MRAESLGRSRQTSPGTPELIFVRNARMTASRWRRMTKKVLRLRASGASRKGEERRHPLQDDSDCGPKSLSP